LGDEVKASADPTRTICDRRDQLGNAVDKNTLAIGAPLSIEHTGTRRMYPPHWNFGSIAALYARRPNLSP
jgi:hypothetical protein